MAESPQVSARLSGRISNRSSPEQSGRSGRASGRQSTSARPSQQGSGRPSQAPGSGRPGSGRPSKRQSGRKSTKDGDDTVRTDDSGKPKSGREKEGRGDTKALGDEDDESHSDGGSIGGDLKPAKKEKKSCRQRLHCPKCKCCMKVFPCMYCCHPDSLLDRDTLIRMMTGTGKTKKNVNMVLIDEQLRQDRENCSDHKRKWRRRWLMCCCCNCCTIFMIAAVVIVLLATNDWTVVNEECSWSPRIHFGMVYTPANELVVVGGTNTLDNLADVWSSSDKGETWTRLVDVAAFGERHGHAMLVDTSTGEFFVIGGEGGSVTNSNAPVPRQDVWKSIDGREWTQVTSSAPWPPRKRFGAALDGSGNMYIVGGLDSMGIASLNDMWKSEDKGRTWSPLALAAPWSARHSFGFVRMPGGTREGRLLILGGSDGRAQHDVWATDDEGKSWHLMTFTHVREMVYRDIEDRASWSPRYGMGAVADNSGVLTLCGGVGDESGEEDSFSKEIWTIESPPPDTVPWYAKRTNDPRLNINRYPRQWKKQGEPAWSARRFLQSFVDEEGVVYIVGGQEAYGVAGLKNDVWKKETSVDLNNLKNAFVQAQSRAQGGGGAVEEDKVAET